MAVLRELKTAVLFRCTSSDTGGIFSVLNMIFCHNLSIFMTVAALIKVGATK